MKSHIDQLEEMEKHFMEEVNRTVLDLLSIKFSQKISEIAKVQICHIIQNHIDGTIWINELKDNLRSYISNYTKELNEQSKQLNIRMDFLEQRMLDMVRIMDGIRYGSDKKGR